MFEQMAKKPAVWLSGEGSDSQVVLSSRVRLARNIANSPFPSRADTERRERILSFVKNAVKKSADLSQGTFVNCSQLDDLDRSFLVERHLVSLEFTGLRDSSALLIEEKENVGVMINEEDHLRIQALASGLEIREAFQMADHIDDELSKSLEFAFDPTFGYLTACPTNTGTGMRASVLIHLPGLALTREIEKVISQISKLGLVVRGFYGEGSDVWGNLFQVSNQTTLGRSEEDIVESLERVTKQMIEYEENARKQLFGEAKDQIEDKIWRAYGILKHARTITSEEVLNMLSAVRLGIGMGVLERVSLSQVNEILALTQPAHLQKYFKKRMEPSERDQVRADLVRSKLGG
ncbi:MAG: protein arginine kinase [candidate division Zixibacteria bacterium]|nr:protein arginine kinase [candidate division Zixibacteria bacterium]